MAAVLALAPFSPTFNYEKRISWDMQALIAEAGGGCFSVDGPCASRTGQYIQAGLTAANTAINSVTAWATGALQLKEFVLDGFAWYAINIVLEEMIRSVTAWVNAGFPSGGPAFVQDFGGFLTNIADGIAGDFILNNTNLGFLCSPFQLDIQFALTSQYLFGRDVATNSYQPQCRISGILQNIQNFSINVNGQVNLEAAYDSRSFASGGWAWWLGAVEDQDNNVFGAYAKAQAALNVALRNAKGEEVKLLEFGQGFLSRKDCDATGNNCQIITPGQVIESQLNKALAGGQERLTVADEINELIAALFGQLVQYVLGSVGLFNTTIQPFADPNSGGSYSSLLDAWSTTAAFGSPGSAGYAYSGPSAAGNTALANAQSYLSLQQNIIDTVNTEEVYLNNALATYPGQISVTSLPQALIDARNQANAEMQRVSALQTQIQSLQTQLSASTTDPTTSTNLLNQITALESQIPSATQTAQLTQQSTSQLQPVIQAFRQQIDADIVAAGGVPTGNSSVNLTPFIPPTINLTATPNPATLNSNSTVSWTTGNATACSASGGSLPTLWSGSVGTSGSVSYGPITTSNTVLSLTCNNSGNGTTTQSVTIFAS